MNGHEQGRMKMRGGEKTTTEEKKNAEEEAELVLGACFNF